MPLERLQGCNKLVSTIHGAAPPYFGPCKPPQTLGKGAASRTMQSNHASHTFAKSTEQTSDFERSAECVCSRGVLAIPFTTFPSETSTSTSWVAMRITLQTFPWMRPSHGSDTDTGKSRYKTGRLNKVMQSVQLCLALTFVLLPLRSHVPRRLWPLDHRICHRYEALPEGTLLMHLQLIYMLMR